MIRSLAAGASLSSLANSRCKSALSEFTFIHSFLLFLFLSAKPKKLDLQFIRMKLYSTEGVLKDSTECAPNGYYFLPIYDKGTFRIEIRGPEGWNFGTLHPEGGLVLIRFLVLVVPVSSSLICAD